MSYNRSRLDPRFCMDIRLFLETANHIAQLRQDELLNTGHVVLAAATHFLGPYGGHPPTTLRNPVDIEIRHELEKGNYGYSTQSSALYASLQGARGIAQMKRYRGITADMLFESMLIERRTPGVAQELLTRLDIPFTVFTKMRRDLTR